MPHPETVKYVNGFLLRYDAQEKKDKDHPLILWPHWDLSDQPDNWFNSLPFEARGELHDIVLDLLNKKDIDGLRKYVSTTLGNKDGLGREDEPASDEQDEQHRPRRG